MKATNDSKIFLVFLFLFLYPGVKAQLPASSFSFSCAKDTVISCGDSCIALKTTVPKIMSTSDAYIVSRISEPEGCFRPYIEPGVQGSAITSSTDDRYSPMITLPFDFPFYGVTYNSLVVSGNGYISFDVSKANSFSHYGILNAGFGLSAGSGTPENLPSTLYDGAIIMAPYHDLDISTSQSPGKLIKYEIIGTAPHRKFVVSFYKVPLFLGSCNGLFENTQQLVLFEGTGIVEVFVYSKQICTGWNDGRAMIGMQNYDRDLGIMAPGRAASDSPWGTIDMNEAWRFTPSNGLPLLKTVELLSLNGQLVANGTAGNGTPGNYKVNFGNICPDSTTTYLVKSTYKNITLPLTEVYGLDTLTVVKEPFVASHSVWTGAVSADWEDPANWACGNLPGTNSNVIINQGNIVVNSNITINSLTVQTGASVIVSPGYNVTVLSDAH